MVTSTGQSTEIGLINAGVQAAKEETSKTPLAQKLDEFGTQLTGIIGVICLAVWLVSIPKFNSPAFSSPLKGAIYYAKVAVALGVAAIPEGLPAVITLCLSLGTRRMAQRNVIVRRLSSVETLGCTSVICTDKTGTLTTNKMTVKALVTMRGISGATSTATTAAAPAPPITATVTAGEEEEEDECSTDRTAEEFEASRSDSVTGSTTPTTTTITSNPRFDLLERSVEGVSYDPVGSLSDFDAQHDMRSPALQLLAAAASLCNEARLELTEDGRFDRIGEPTEAALKVLVEKLGACGVERSAEPVQMARQFSDHWAERFQTLSVLEFSRQRKSMSVLVRPRPSFSPSSQQLRQPGGSGGSSDSVSDGNPVASDGWEQEEVGGAVDNYLFVKGAAEILAQRCNRVQLEDGSVVALTPEMRAELMEKFSELAQRPLRCLALAYKTGKELGELNIVGSPDAAADSVLLKDPSAYETIESDLVLLGLCGIKDPARPEAAEAIAKCSRAGIRVMMITGDSKETAVAIARDVNIFDARTDVETSAFTGREFFALDPATQLALLRTGNKVFCRAEPVDKQRLISMLEQLDEITAMTGDGVNDAPALQQAAIGIAMGIAGTEVAKGAADMILADDNFSTIVSAVEEGRNIYSNMQTFVCFLISCNIGEVVSIFLATLLGFPEPLTPLQVFNLPCSGHLSVSLYPPPPPPKTTIHNKSSIPTM